jgi:hypothetical protein
LCIVLGAVVIPSPKPDASTVLGLPKLCLIRNITGIACPGCGMTRSLIASAHLHLEDAITFHPLGPVMLLLLGIYGLLRLVGHRNQEVFTNRDTKLVRTVALLLTGCFLLVWIARLAGFISTPN